MPIGRLKDMSVRSRVVFIVMGLFTALILYVAVNYAIDFWATFYCSGWNEGSGTVTSCSIPGIEDRANGGYNLMLISAFTLYLPYFLPAFAAFLTGAYWAKKKQAWKNDVLSSKLFAWTGLTISALAFLVFVVVFLLSSTPIISCVTQWGAPWAPKGCGI